MEQLDLQFTGPILALLTPDEIFASASQSLLALLKEDRRIEFKSSKVDRRSLGEYYSMWANTKGAGGLIVIGIEKDGTVSGCLRLSNPDLNDIEKTGKEICPDCREELKRIPVVNSSVSVRPTQGSGA
jgi:ATP-dependent DNA helicase RecG